MGLRAKFNLVLLAAFVVGLALAATLSYRIVRQNAQNEVEHEAAIMITTASAIRDYTAKEIKPLLVEQLKVRFLPHVVSAWAAQTNLRALSAQFPNYAYKEAALNPTNLNDRAQDWEADIIRNFREDASNTEMVVERDTPLGPTLNLARPVTITDQACLLCHDTSSAAPASLTQTYGSANGFGWKVNETVGAQIVSVPMAVPLKAAHDAYIAFLGTLIGIFAIIVVILNLLLHYVVIMPVKQVSAAAEAVSLGEENIPLYVKPGKDEISALSVAFNRMRESLKQAMDMIK